VKGNDDARPVHRIITMIKWIRTIRFSIKNSLSLQGHDGMSECFCNGVPGTAVSAACEVEGHADFVNAVAVGPYFAEMCSGSEESSYLRLIDCQVEGHADSANAVAVGPPPPPVPAHCHLFIGEPVARNIPDRKLHVSVMKRTLMMMMMNMPEGLVDPGASSSPAPRPPHSSPAV